MATKTKPQPCPPPDQDEIQLETVGEWTDEHTKVIAQLLVDLEDQKHK